MSLVQAFIYKDFIIVGGEKRAVLQDGEIIDNFNKVLKLNECVIIGMTGTIEGNACLFSNFINRDFSMKKKNFDLDYNEMIEVTNRSYYGNQEFLNEHSVHSVVCGWDGEKLTGVSYFTNDNNTDYNKPIDLTPEYDGHMRVVNCGMNEHYLEACRLFEKNKPNNILQFKNLFRDVIDNGIKFDPSINNNVSFETIIRKNVCNSYKRD